MSWVEIGVVLLAVVWLAGLGVSTMLEARRASARWRAEEAALQASMEAALRELDDVGRATRPTPPI